MTTEAVRDRAGAVGILVRDVPEPKPQHLLATLDSLRRDEGVDLRVAYLREGGDQAIKVLGLDPNLYSHTVEKAEAWRNQ